MRSHILNIMKIKCPKCKNLMQPIEIADFDDRLQFICTKNYKHKPMVKLLRKDLKRKWEKTKKELEKMTAKGEIFIEAIKCFADCLEKLQDADKNITIEDFCRYCTKEKKQMCIEIEMLCEYLTTR